MESRGMHRAFGMASSLKAHRIPSDAEIPSAFETWATRLD